jgi:hypothetical protein
LQRETAATGTPQLLNRSMSQLLLDPKRRAAIDAKQWAIFAKVLVRDVLI